MRVTRTRIEMDGVVTLVVDWLVVHVRELWLNGASEAYSYC